MCFSGGQAQTNANNDQSAINSAVGTSTTATNDLLSQFLNQVAPGLLGIAQGQTQQPQIQALTNTLNNSNQSALATEKSQLGGVANPNALFQNIALGNAQSGEQAAQGMQSNLTGQQTSAYGDLASVFQSALGGNNSLISSLNQNQASNQSTANQNQNANLGLFGSLLGGLFG